VTASFGVSAFGGRGDDLERLIQRADAALYESKCAGRDRATAATQPGGEPAAPVAPDTVAPR
jgi:PleD family two-component response regulator